MQPKRKGNNPPQSCCWPSKSDHFIVPAGLTEKLRSSAARSSLFWGLSRSNKTVQQLISVKELVLVRKDIDRLTEGGKGKNQPQSCVDHKVAFKILSYVPSQASP